MAKLKFIKKLYKTGYTLIMVIPKTIIECLELKPKDNVVLEYEVGDNKFIIKKLKGG